MPTGKILRKPEPEIWRLLIFVGALIAAIVLLIVFRRIFQPLILGFGIAYLFDPIVSWFESKGRSRIFGTMMLILGLVLAMTITMLWLIPTVTRQAKSLTEKLPAYQARLNEQVKPMLEKYQARFPDEIEEVRARISENIKENLPGITASVGRMVGEAFTDMVRLLLFFLNLVFVPVFAFYLLVDFPKFRESVVGLIPVPYRENVVGWVGEVDGAISGFLRGQLTIAMVLAAINGLGLLVIGVPMGLAIGIVAGLANMIPYMALVVGVAPALLLCWMEYQSMGRLVAVIAVFAVAQMLEGLVLSPRILGASVNLHPVVVMLSIIAGGSLFGFIGMLIAVPAAAAIQVFANHWIVAYKESKIYTGSENLVAES